MRGRFFEKKVLITGASGYLGNEISRRFIEEGAIVALCGRNLDKLEEVKRSQNTSNAQVFFLDVKDENNIKDVFESFSTQNNGLDILINCSGGGLRENKKYLKYQDISLIDNILDVNLRGAILCSREALKYMKKGSRIISIGSYVGESGQIQYSEYAAAKSGLVGFTKALAKEVGSDEITVNMVSPGNVPRTPELRKDGGKYTFLGKSITAQACSHAVTFLASEEAEFITGENLFVDGGGRLALKGLRSEENGIYNESVDLLSTELEKMKKYIIYGTGKRAEKAYIAIKEQKSDVIAFTDSSKEKWGSSFHNIMIKAPRELYDILPVADAIVIASVYEREISITLHAFGIEEDKIIYFRG